MKKKDEFDISQDVAGGWDRWEKQDRDALSAAGDAYNSATDEAGRNLAHAQGEAVREKYGYSGGVDGSQYLKLPSGGGQRTGYGGAPAYTSKYQGQIDQLSAALLGRDPFSYDHTTDDTYQQYEKSYTRNGQRAMEDTLGQVSGRTGGLASSYATSASQQSYEGYMAALADKIPELRQLAYSMYQDEGNSQRANLEMLMAMDQGEYGRQQDALGQYNLDRNFQYGQQQDALGQYNTDRNFSYGQQRDQVEDGRYDKEWNYGVGRDQVADARYEQERRAAGRSTQVGKGSSSPAFGGGSSTGTEKPKLTLAQAQAAIEKGQSTQAVMDAYDYYMGDGSYDTYFGAEKQPEMQIFNDYSTAVSFMEDNGIPTSAAVGAMTQSEWTRRKAALQKYGQGGTEVKDYNSYSDYLTNYVQYRLENQG